MKQQKKLRIGVFCGGDSNERNISLLTGDQITKALIFQGYLVYTIRIEGDGKWIISSIEKNFRQKEVSVQQISKYIDVAFIALHGKYGEDGTIQKIFDFHNILYTGSGPQASALGMDKEKCSQKVSSCGIYIPKTVVYTGAKDHLYDIKKKIDATVGFPCIVKPNASGSSVGITLVNYDSELESAIKQAEKEDERVIIQEYILGKEFSCGVLGNRDSEKIVLPIVEIRPKNHIFFDYEAKYKQGETNEICPADIEVSLLKELQDSAKKVHELLECDGLTRSDFRVDSSGKIFFLEINTIPGQTRTSLCPKEAAALGWSFPDFIMKQIELALEK